MNDLIWIGNTLYPRWFVFGSAGLILLIIVSLYVWATEPRKRP